MKIFTLVILLSFSLSLSAQTYNKDSSVYRIKWGIDAPIAAAGTAWTLYGFSKIYGRENSTDAEILALNPANINRIDRGTANNYSLSAKSVSDKFFYGSMPLPLFLLIDRNIRHDGHKVMLLYLEAQAITGTLYTIAAMSANRYRPYAYNPEVDFNTRKRGGAKNSFYAGHVALVGTSTFFTASVLDHYHPNWKNKWLLYTAAGAATATTGLMRIKAGQHFKTDVMLGVVMGTASGLLVPRLHRNKKVMQKVSISPYFNEGAKGFSLAYNLN